MLFFYNLSIRFYYFVLQIASIASPKAKLWINGRKNLFEKLKEIKKKENQHLIWIHCASLGEFEQGRPVIEGLKKRNPSILIILTFFSPSGYEIRRNYPLVDAVHYLPLDTKANAEKFVKIIQPDLAIFVKYEFWYNHLSALNQAKIPILLISSIFSKHHIFFKFYGGVHRKMLQFFNTIFVQDKNSLKNLKILKFNMPSFLEILELIEF